MNALINWIDGMRFSDQAHELFSMLTSQQALQHSETTAVILVAASKHLIRLQPSIILGGPDTIIDEFADLVRHFGKWVDAPRTPPSSPPKLRIVGGTDSYPQNLTQKPKEA